MLKTRLSLFALALGALCVTPAGASAATRHAAPGSTVTTGACPAEQPCEVTYAVEGAAAGDEVVLAAGEYTVASRLDVPAGVSVRGADGERPRVRASAQSTEGTLAVSGGTVRHLYVRGKATGQPALSLAGGTAEDLVVVSEAGTAVSVTRAADTTVLRDSVLRTVANAGRGLTTADGAGTGAIELRNLTIYATGGEGVAIVSEATSGSVTALNVLARGGFSDVASAGGQTVGLRNSNFRPDRAPAAQDLGGNGSGTPVFADVEAGDYRPAAGSPTIDAGLADAFLGLADPDGLPRVLGAAPDVGAFEYVPGSNPPVAGSDGDPGGTGNGRGQTPDGLPRPKPRPEPGKGVNAAPARGEVRVRVPGGRSETLTEGASLPVGSIVDTTEGAVRLTAASGAGATQTAEFTGTVFTVRQVPGPKPVTELVLPKFDRSACRGTGKAATAKRRRLWGRGRGRWRSRGRGGSASVRGTWWMTEDTCKGTRFKVREGKVWVRDFFSGRGLLLTPGKQYFARVAR